MSHDQTPQHAGRRVRIVQLTDFHLLADPTQSMMGINTDESFLSVKEAAQSRHWPADLCLLTGDLAQEARPETYRRLRNYLQTLGVPCYCLPGNHDAPWLMDECLVGGNVYHQSHVLLDRWQIILLDSTISGDPGGYLADKQLQSLEILLAAHKEHFALVALHHSPLPTGSLWLDTMRLRNADEFMALLARHGHVKGVVYGHVHQAMDNRVGNLRLLACPSSCFQFKPASGDFALDALPPGYRWLDLYPDGKIVTGVERLQELPRGLDMTSVGY